MSSKCNIVLSAVCGVIFAAAWWIFADAVAYADTKPGQNAGKFEIYVPGILATIGLFLMSNLPTSMFAKNSGEEHTWWQKLILVLSIMCMLAGIIESVWIYVAKKNSLKEHSYTDYRGIAPIAQSIMITVISFAWNFLYQDPNAY